ncbi:hypothetical protein CPB86DRAFT_877616 [Serendipita vermifera]|nr:hypothetical protein CPB86DRAFT_877616 [Serendipita vermifera]
MAAVVAPRKSLDVESSRSPSVAAQNPSAPKTIKRIFQDTLRVTGLTRSRDRDGTVNAKQSIPPPSTVPDKNKDKEKEKQKLKEESKRGLKVTFTRKSKPSASSRLEDTENNNDERPFMGSLRHASMSSPVLPLSTNPFALPSSSSTATGSAQATSGSPVRPKVQPRRGSTTSRDKEPITPLQISRPRSLVPTSPSSPTSPNHSTPAGRSVSPQHRNRSPQPRMTRFPSISTSNLPGSSIQRAVSPTFHSRNTSTTSLNSSSPYREVIRTASSLLIKHLARPPPPLKQEDWQDVEVRLRALSRLERIWGRSGGGSSATAVGSASGYGGGEERERRLFCEAVRDGYVLCALLNKFRPGTVNRPDPKEDGFTRTSNVTKFLAGAVNSGLHQSDLFLRNDLLEASSESLGRVAQTIVALVKLNESTMLVNGKGPYMSIRDGSMSSPNLLETAPRPSIVRSPQRKRYSPPSALPPVPGSSSGKPSTPENATVRQTRSMSMSVHPTESASRSTSPMVPSPPPRSPLRPALSTRASVGSSLADTNTIFSSSDNRTSTRFGTLRTVNTEATSIHPSDTSSVVGVTRSSKAVQEPIEDQPPQEYETQFTELPKTTRRRSYDREASAARLALASSQSIDVSPTRPRRERRSSDMMLSNDLSNVEEVDEMGTRRGRLFVGLAAESSLLNPTILSVSPKRPSFDRPRPSLDRDELFSQPQEIDLSTSPTSISTEKAGLPMRRPMHGHRHSVDTVATTTPTVLLPRHSSLSKERDRQPSPSSSRESSTPSPPSGMSRPILVPRKSSSRPSPRASYVPKLNIVDDARPSGPYRHQAESDQIETASPTQSAPRVPFPRSTSGDLSSAVKGSPRLSRLNSLPGTAGAPAQEQEQLGSGASGNVANGISRNVSIQAGGSRPAYARGRYNSELDTTGTRARKPRPTSLDDGGVRPGRSRFESMINLGTGADGLSRESSLSVNAVRQPLVVREEGKPPMHYQIGNGIGRGQFGAVYRALNLNTGQMVAVKRISLQGLSEDEISNLMKEVDVLKRLSHPSIVKYEGMVRSTDTLSIVLEYVENGSLGQTLKAFGKLNERLVAQYVTKILEGLHYLHQSHVVHCDLKAANILTTKNGNVKLSDFGVSLNLHAKAMEEIKNDVAGTPNWMAPEVIELKGPSPASDIWSLGCTAIELLTGHPPYHEINNGMSVMFRIVEDPMPPIPGSCSPLMDDFLRQCFKKNPLERPSAEMLFEHPWLKATWEKDLRPQDSIPFLRRVSVELNREGRTGPPDVRQVLAESPRSGDLHIKTSLASPQIGPLTPLSPDSAEGAARQHSFIKTTFGRAVTCRVCHQSVKRSAVLCEECGLIAHARCAADAPASCDIRMQLLLYSQYSQASNSQELSSPTTESSSPLPSAPIAIPGSPGSPALRPRVRRQSDATYSSSPKLADRLLGPWRKPTKLPEPSSPPLPAVMGPSSYHPPRDDAPTPTPTRSGGRTSLPSSSPPRQERMRKHSRLSIQSNAKTDSMRSMVTAAETVNGSTTSYDSTPRSSVAHNRRQAQGPQTINGPLSNSVTTQEGHITSDTRRLNTRISALSSNASEFGEERRRIKRNPRDSVSSRDSQCVIQ